MRRNIWLSFAIHVVVLAGTILLFAMGCSPLALVLAAFIGYLSISYAWLVPLRSVWADLASISLVSLTGFAIGLICMGFPGMMGFNWMIFLAYNIHSLPMAETFDFSPARAARSGYYFFRPS